METSDRRGRAAERAEGNGVAEELSFESRQALVRRDAAALAQFFDVYFPRVYGYVRRLIPDEHEAEDLVQDVFLNLWRSLESYDPARELKPWIFSIATNRLRDYWRAKRPRAGLLDADDEALSGAREPSQESPPELPLETRESQEELRQALEALPEGLRMVVHLRAFEGLEFDAIGRAIGRNEVAVRKRYSRALDGLRERLRPKLPRGEGSAR